MRIISVLNKIKIVCFLLCLFVFVSCQQSKNKWHGTYEGTTTESSQGLSLSQNGETKYFPGGRSITNYTVSLTQENKVSFVTIGETCKLRLYIDDAKRAHVSEGQTCQISINGFDGKVNITGQAYFEDDGKLMIQITGTAAEPNASGGYAFNFQGKKVD